MRQANPSSGDPAVIRWPSSVDAFWPERASGACERPASLAPPATSPTQSVPVHSRLSSISTPPAWMLALYERRASPEAALATLVRRVRAHPNSRTLTEALLLINELGRRPDAQAPLRATITQALIDELTERQG
jgi:hypothetical protein